MGPRTVLRKGALGLGAELTELVAGSHFVDRRTDSHAAERTQEAQWGKVNRRRLGRRSQGPRHFGDGIAVYKYGFTHGT